VTAAGLMDDVIESERYLVYLEGAARQKLKLKSLGRQVKNWKGRGPQGWRK